MKAAFFLAPAGRGQGLTTVALGLVAALDRRGVRVSFYKPISEDCSDQSRPELSTHFLRATTTLAPPDSLPLPVPPNFPASTRSVRSIGGGYVGCELAAIYRARRVKVTLVEAESRLLPSWDEDIGKRMLQVLDEAGVEVLFNEQVPLPDATSNILRISSSAGSSYLPI